MLSHLDLWRAANVIIERSAAGAATEAAMRADEFLDQGIIDGERLWIRIMQTIEELQRERPRDIAGRAAGSPSSLSTRPEPSLANPRTYGASLHNYDILG